MDKLKFLKQYIKNPRSIGAITPSSKKLAVKMIDNIDFQNCKCIIEYGPGTGVFTELILNKKLDDTLLIAIEYNVELYLMLKEKFENRKNLILINDSAENVCEYLLKLNIDKADYIVSGLPFASLPAKMSTNILNTTRLILKSEGTFITFQYTLLKINLFKKHFCDISFDRVLLNLPPAYVLKCCNT